MADERATSAVDKTLGVRVRLRRLEIGMSQEQLAAKLGVTFQQVQKYERGVNRIAASRLLDICAALEVGMGELFEGLQARGKSKTARDNLDALDTPGAIELLKLYGDIESASVRRRVLELVRAMTSKQDA